MLQLRGHGVNEYGLHVVILLPSLPNSAYVYM